MFNYRVYAFILRTFFFLQKKKLLNSTWNDAMFDQNNARGFLNRKVFIPYALLDNSDF